MWDRVAWVAWRSSWSRVRNYYSAQFNVQTRGLIPGPSPDPCPTGDVLILLGCFPKIQERLHWLIFVGIRSSFVEFDVNDGFSLSIP